MSCRQRDTRVTVAALAVVLLLTAIPAVAQSPLDDVPFDDLRELDPWSQSTFGRSFTENTTGDRITELYLLGFSLETSEPVDDLLYLEIRNGELRRLELRTTVARAESPDLLFLLGNLPEQDIPVPFLDPFTIRFPAAQRNLEDWLLADSAGIAYLQESGEARGLVFEFPQLRILLDEALQSIDPRLTYLEIWTSEQGQALAFVQDSVDRFVDTRPWVNLHLRELTTEELRANFLRSPQSLAEPTLLWTSSNLLGEFLSADLLQSTDGLFAEDELVPTAVEDGLSWGVPVSTGNFLLLLYDQRRVPTAPATTEEIRELAANGVQLVWPSAEPFWFAPWVGGFGGELVAGDGRTPALDTEPVIRALDYLRDLVADGVLEPDMDYAAMNSAFLEGPASLAFNGDWALADYASYDRFQGLDPGIAALPRVSETGLPLVPWSAPSMLLLPLLVSGARYREAAEFIAFVTDSEQQLRLARDYGLVPVRRGTLDDYADELPLLAVQAEAARFAVPQPSRPELDSVFTAIRTYLPRVLSGELSPAVGANLMQQEALSLIGD